MFSYITQLDVIKLIWSHILTCCFSLASLEILPISVNRKAVKSPLKPTYVFSQSTHVIQVYLENEVPRVWFSSLQSLFSHVLSGSQVFGPPPPLCKWAAFGISCPWNMTSRLTSSMRLLAPACARVLGKLSPLLVNLCGLSLLTLVYLQIILTESKEFYGVAC